MSDRLVKCAKYGKELRGLEQPPFPGALGQRIYEGVSQQAWNEWQERSVEISFGMVLRQTQKLEAVFVLELLRAGGMNL